MNEGFNTCMKITSTVTLKLMRKMEITNLYIVKSHNLNIGINIYRWWCGIHVLYIIPV